MAITIKINKHRPANNFTISDVARNDVQLKSKIKKMYSNGLRVFVYLLNVNDCEYEDGVKYYLYKKI